MNRSTDATFQCVCPHCGARLRAQTDQAGGEFGCPKCGGAIRLPTPGETPAATARSRPADGGPSAADAPGGSGVGQPSRSQGKKPKGTDEPVYVAVVCAHCNTRMHATLADVGRKIECPDCGVKSLVRQPIVETPRPRPSLDDVEAYEVWDSEQDPNLHPERDPEAYVPVVCELCDTHLSATAEQIGQQVVCPDCGHRTRVKPPPKEVPKRTLPGVEMENRQPYQLGPAVATPAVEQLVAMGGTEVDEERAHTYGYGKDRRKVAQLPPWPFINGVWNFLWYPGVLARVLVLWPWLAIAVFMISAGVASAFSNPFMAVPLLAFGAASMGLWIVVASAIYLTVVSETGNGADEIDWPDAVFLDWMFLGFYFVTSYTCALLPAVALQSLLGGTVNEFVLSLLSVGSAYALFPVVLLSMLENGSPVGPFSPKVWGSIWQFPGRWFTCYALVAVVLAVQLICLGLTVQLGVIAAFVFGPAVVVIGMMTVYRLIGRLAFCCSMVSATDDEPFDDLEDREGEP